MTTKKKTTKKEENNLPALTEAGLTSSALATHANYDLTQFEGVGLDISDNKEIFKNDILIPKIWLIQAMSELRKQKKADEGDFVDSQTGEILAGEGETLNFVVLKTFKRWQTFKLVKEGNKTKKEFVSSELIILGKNENLPYEDVIDGEDVTRRQVLSAYVLIERDAVMGLNKPYIIDFASSSKHAGRKMVSDITTLNNNKLPSFVAYFKMTSKEQNFDDGSAFVKDVNFGGYLPKTSIPFLVSCYKGIDLEDNTVEIDDRDIVETNTTPKKETNVTKKVQNTEARL